MFKYLAAYIKKFTLLIISVPEIINNTLVKSTVMHFLESIELKSTKLYIHP